MTTATTTKAGKKTAEQALAEANAAARATPAHRAELLDVHVGLLQPHPDNPRSDVGDVTELAQSIREQGVLEPLVVVPAPGATPGGAFDAPFSAFRVLMGHRRLAGAHAASVAMVPCIIRRDLDDPGAQLEVMLVENMQRSALTPLDEARAFRRLLDQGYKQARIVERTGVSQGHVSKRLALLKLPDELQAEVVAENLSVTDAYELSKLADQPEVLAKAVEIAKDNAGDYGEDGYAEVAQAVEYARTDALGAALVAKAAADWTERGVTVVDEPHTFFKSYWQHRLATVLEKNPVPAKDIEKHLKDGCAAVTLTAPSRPTEKSTVADVRVEHYCTTPKNHQGTAKKKPADPYAAQQAAAREEQKLLREARTARQSFIAESLLKGKLSSRDMQAYIASAVLGSKAPILGAFELVAEWLGGVPGAQLDGLSAADWIRGAAAKASDLERERLVFASLLAATEEYMNASWNDWRGHTALHFTFLTDRGYALTEVEQLRLDKDNPKTPVQQHITGGA